MQSTAWCAALYTVHGTMRRVMPCAVCCTMCCTVDCAVCCIVGLRRGLH